MFSIKSRFGDRLWGGALLAALVFCVFQHAHLGVQVVIEDYIHAEGLKIALLLLVKGGAWLFGGICALSVLKLAFGG